MTILMIEYDVEDFNRLEGGVRLRSNGPHVVRGRQALDLPRPDDPNHHMLGMEFATAQQAKEFRAALAPMWEVSGAGQAWNLEEVEEAEAPSPMVMVDPMPINYFVYRLIPPRPTFPVDITDCRGGNHGAALRVLESLRAERNCRRTGPGARAGWHVGARSHCWR